MKDLKTLLQEFNDNFVINEDYSKLLPSEVWTLLNVPISREEMIAAHHNFVVPYVILTYKVEGLTKMEPKDEELGWYDRSTWLEGHFPLDSAGLRSLFMFPEDENPLEMHKTHSKLAHILSESHLTRAENIWKVMKDQLLEMRNIDIMRYPVQIDMEGNINAMNWYDITTVERKGILKEIYPDRLVDYIITTSIHVVYIPMRIEEQHRFSYVDKFFNFESFCLRSEPQDNEILLRPYVRRALVAINATTMQNGYNHVSVNNERISVEENKTTHRHEDIF
jgi:hypothetical protein